MSAQRPPRPRSGTARSGLKSALRQLAPAPFGPLLRGLLLALFLAPAFPAGAQVVISEFVADNLLGRKDDDGDYEDWIELHNPGSSPANLAGWFLTDSAANPRQWEFPAVTLDPGGFLVVYASNKDRRTPGQPLHTNFRLAAGGEYLALLRPDLTPATAFAPAYPPQVPDVGYGFPAAAAAVSLVGLGSPARFHVPTDDALGTNWLATEFADGSWTPVSLPIGWDTGRTVAEVVVADSVADWSDSGEPGHRGWSYGTYTKATDPNGSYAAADFVPFGAGEWNGTLWRTPAAGTARVTLGVTDGRPGGSDTGGERWAIRRWKSSVAGTVSIQWRLAKRASGGTGVNARLFHGGLQRDTVTVSAQSVGQVTRTVTLADVQVGDPIDLALTPLGSGSTTDSVADDAQFSMTISASGSLTNLIQTDVAAALRGRNPSAYLRIPFAVTNLADLDTLELRLRHDDGFLAFLNGHLVAQRNAPVESAGGVVGDQDDDWAGTDDQGVKGWYYGFYDQAADPDHTYDPYADFDNVDPQWAWNGTTWSLGPGDPPWTTVGRDTWHPNGGNGGANVQWAIRRWVCQTAGTVKVLLAGAKENAGCGNGVTYRLLVNGVPRFARTLPFDDTAGFATTVLLENLGFGDYVDFALDPTGPDGATQDGCDGSIFAAQILQDPQPGPTWNSAALRARLPAETAQPEILDLSRSRDRLLPGTNVLALHALNVAAEDVDFLVAPELSARFARVETSQGRYFTTPTPGAFNAGGGTETLGPVVETVEAQPRVPGDADDLTITAWVRPTLRPVAAVTLTYRIQFNAELTAPMFDDGVHGDGRAGDGVWGARIPAAASAPGQMVRWAVTATDTGGAGLRSPAYPDPRRSPQYHGTMVADPALATNPVPVLHWFIQNPASADSDAGGRGSLFFAGEFYDNILANLHGQSTRGFPKKSYDFDFNPGHNFRWREGQPRVDDFNLLTTWADKSHFRNVLAYETYEQAGAPAHFAFPVRVQQNGRFHSLANLVENGDDNFLERLGLDPRGALYKMYNTANSAAGNEKKTRKNEGTQDLAALIQALGTGTSATRQAALFDQLDLPEVVNYLAARALTGDTDCCHKNYYLYRDTEGSGEWLAFPWDVDLSFGRVWTCGSPCFAYYDETIYTNTGLLVGDNNTVFSLVLATPATRAMYARRLRTLMDDLTQPPGVAPAADRWLQRTTQLRDLLAPDATLDLAKWGTWGRRETITQAVDRIHREFLPGRREFLFGNRVRAGVLPATQPADATVRFGVVEFRGSAGNPRHEYLTLTNPNPYAVDVSDWQLAGDVRFRFQPGTVLPSRSTAFVSPDRREFRARTASPHGGEGRLVVGDYQGRLSARGGTLELLDRTGRRVDTRAFAGAPSPTQTALRISEILYHRSRSDAPPDVEFVELRNLGNQTLDLAGVRFVEGITFEFSTASIRSLAPGQHLVIVNSLAAFQQAYGSGRPVAGVFAGSLDNSGERLRLEDADGEPILDFRYPTDAVPAADGHGFTLVAVDPAAPPNRWDEPGQWRASARPGGSPGLPDDPGLPAAPVTITEILTHTDPPLVDTVELHNPTALPVDVGGWLLTDRSEVPAKYRLPTGTVIPPGGYVAFDETQFNRPTNAPTSFAFSSHGDTVWLFAADPAGQLTGYADAVRVPASANGVSFGRHTNSAGDVHFPAQRELTLGHPNTGPKVGPLVIAEIHPRPARGESPFVEIRNLTSDTVPLYDPSAPTNTWRLAGVDLAFPPGLSLPPGGLLLAVGGDPAAFRLRHGIPPAIPILGPWPGTLQTDGERLALERPDPPDLLPDGSWFVPYVVVDEIHYAARTPWPDLDLAPGSSLERLSPSAYGDEPRNWRASPSMPTPGTGADANRAPVVAPGPDQNLESPRFPYAVLLAGSARDDGIPVDAGQLSLAWTQIEGPGLAEFVDPSQANTTVHLPGPGRFVLRLTAFDGAAAASADLVVILARPGAQPTLVPKGASWRYFAAGTEPAADWIHPAFDDASWPVGAAQLGYGDGDEATVLPAEVNGTRLLTAYFRRAFTVVDVDGVRSLTLRLLRDDGAAIWLNGQPAYRVNLPEGPLAYATPATATVAGTEESTFHEQALAPTLLREGPNVLAVEVHQQSAGSSDLGFDLELLALSQPTNRPPTVSAGPDTALAVRTPGRLAGSWSDDGLPQAATRRWHQVAGPGPAEFTSTNLAAPWVTLPTPGTYDLRLTVSDGAFTVSDDVRILAGDGTSDPYLAWKQTHFGPDELADPAVSGDHADPDDDGQSNLAEYGSGTLPRDPRSVLRLTAEVTGAGSIRLRFEAMAGRTYRLEWRDSVTPGPWQTLQRLEAGPENQAVTLADPQPPASQTGRFYRIATPAPATEAP